MFARITIFIVGFYVSVIFIMGVVANDLPKQFPFDEENALTEWQEKIFKDKVMYEVEPIEQDGYLVAKSDQACSGLMYKIKYDVRENPMISWSWKVKKFPEQTELIEKGEGWIEEDDYAARVYVIFHSWNFMNIKSLQYVWDEELPVGEVVPSPYHKNIKKIVAESGSGNLDQWVFERRNIFDDFKKAFGTKPPRHVGAIALMTDADNTLSTAEAFYKDIKVGYKDE